MAKGSGQRMRVLFACVPQTGHVTPLLPLATEFAAHGASVVFGSGSDVENAVTKRGLGFHAIGPDFGEWFGVLKARTCGTPGDGLPTERVEPYFFPRLFGEVGLSLTVDGLTGLAREMQPDLIVFEPYLLAAPLVATQLGIRAVHHAIGPLPEAAVLQLVNDAVTPAWRAAGLDSPSNAGLFRDIALTICPPSLDPAGAALARALAMRPAALPLPNAMLPVALPRPDLPLVYVTLGTFSNDPKLFRLILQAIAEVPINVLATIGADADPASLGTLPANAVVERFVAQADVLPHCAAVIHHAGAGTMFGVLAHGVPSLVLPRSADNFGLAQRLGVAGAARVLMPHDVSESSIADGLRDVLGDPQYRVNARQIADEIAQMPPPSEIVDALTRESGAPAVHRVHG